MNKTFFITLNYYYSFFLNEEQGLKKKTLVKLHFFNSHKRLLCTLVNIIDRDRSLELGQHELIALFTFNSKYIFSYFYWFQRLLTEMKTIFQRN